MAADSREYEVFVQGIAQVLLHAQGLERVEVKHDVQVQGLSRSHQVDVYWEYRVGGVDHRVIINCKRYGGTVEVTDVLTLAGVLHDVPGAVGVIVTTVGFQKGATDYARTHGIGLKVIRPPEDDDWAGYIRSVACTLRLDQPELRSCFVEVDRDWVAANRPEPPEALVGPATTDAGLTVVRDLATGEARDMNDLWNRAVQEHPTEVGHEGVGTLRWGDARLERPGLPTLKVNSITFRWFIRMGQDELILVSKREPRAIVRDAIAGTLLFVDPDGTVTGDVEEELGRKPR